MPSTLRQLLSSLAIACLGATAFASSASATATADTTAPILTRATLPEGTYGPMGEHQAMTFSLTVTDESNIKYVVIRHLHEDPALRATPLEARWYGDDLDVQALTWTTSGWYSNQSPLDGPYLGSSIYVEDVAGNGAEYRSDGSVRYSSGATGTHEVDLSLRLTVAAGRDVTPPVLSSFWAPEQAVAGYAGPEAFFSFDVVDPILSTINVFGRVGDGQEIDFGRETALYGRQRGSILFRPSTIGEARVTRVVLTDSNGNRSTYSADGRVLNQPALGLPVTTTEHDLGLASQVTRIVSPTIVGLGATPKTGSIDIAWSQPAFNAYRLTVQPGNKIITGEVDWSVGYTRHATITGLTNGVAYTVAVTQVTQQGLDLDSATVTAAPRMGPVRVFGTGDRSKDGRADLWAALAPTATNRAATWRIYQGAGGGKFKSTLSTTIPATRAPIPGSSTGKGPGAPLGVLYLNGGDLIQPTTTSTRVLGHGFNVFRTIDASSDLTGDGIADLIGITPAGDFYRYTSTSTGAIGRGVRLGGGWQTFQAVFSPGDFDGDKRSDIVGVDGLGKLWLYPGNGRGGFLTKKQIGSGWAGFGSVLPMRDFSGDGKVDIGAITMDGKLLMYPGNGRGGFLTKSQIGTGWGAFL
ncbi:FG-GAP-like repeat-containing protein [Knoellia sp. Soil729]|uniref:FG-GAP-like repeat-containing protein n=1 Tax=Knoellia sp. Soil729 TaxID=1736394 RepID=UPI0006F5C7AD|nr:FG-GAP-like repeat-containing protein [Knoellia sp. Soil729]KRE42411.1 hypothetical protein ASG74_08245 [Knoellia sp. Soil729]